MQHSTVINAVKPRQKRPTYTYMAAMATHCFRVLKLCMEHGRRGMIFLLKKVGHSIKTTLSLALIGGEHILQSDFFEKC